MSNLCCEACKYTANTKALYNAHIKTAKHIKNTGSPKPITEADFLPEVDYSNVPPISEEETTRRLILMEKRLVEDMNVEFDLMSDVLEGFLNDLAAIDSRNAILTNKVKAMIILRHNFNMFTRLMDKMKHYELEHCKELSLRALDIEDNRDDDDDDDGSNIEVDSLRDVWPDFQEI